MHVREQGGRLAVLSAEGGILGQMSGRYSSSWTLPGGVLGRTVELAPGLAVARFAGGSVPFPGLHVGHGSVLLGPPLSEWPAELLDAGNG